ncbi:MAG: ISKra4 family transposase [Actinomycetota bacterium]|nr:ISKra4 family transposase [Actinomycetota bacterium]MDQ6949314.1 ISKra4 family transposase [Actinomycetota bacterium]
MSSFAAQAATFEASRESFEETLGWLKGPDATVLTHAELEDQLDCRGRELLRLMLQDHLSLRAATESRLEAVVDADAVTHGAVESGHRRPLATIFGEVDVERLAYRHRGHPNLYPADAVLNLPAERHSHTLRRLAAVESSRGSFEEASEAVERATGQHVAKRQVEALASRAATDVEEFYRSRTHGEAADSDVLVISADGKGIVMRPDGLRPATARAAAATTKLDCRLSKGEKRNRKRLAEVGAVYDLTPVVRTPADILASNSGGAATPAPKAKAKWVTASVVDDAAVVIRKVFDEAERRDPRHRRRWVGLVDGNNHQIDRIQTEAKARGVDITIVVDLIHVLEYLWGAVWAFFEEGDTAAEAWVRDRTLAVLEGNARVVAAGIRRRATAAGLSKQKRIKADACAKYLTNKAEYLDYPTALAAGWPIASGVIEGTCRYVVADRMDITGARWSVDGAEAVLKLRAVRANNDFSEYWEFHLTKERQRIHETRYATGTIPMAA